MERGHINSPVREGDMKRASLICINQGKIPLLLIAILQGIQQDLTQGNEIILLWKSLAL